MADLILEWDKSAARFLKVKGFDRALSRVLYMAGRDGAKTLKTDAARYVREHKNFKYGEVLKALPVRNPVGRRISALVWTMSVSGKPVPMGKFPVRQTKKGVTAKITKGKLSHFKSAFIQRVINLKSLNDASIHRGVFVRARGAKRYPIRHLLTTRVSDVFGDNGMIPGIQGRALSAFSKSFTRLMPLEIEKLK